MQATDEVEVAEPPSAALTARRTPAGEPRDGTHPHLVLGRYRLGRRLGAGGFGTVHEAHDERLDRWVAVKVIPSDGAAPERARREALAAARLDHPGVVAIFDAGEEPGARYLVSELVEGRTLAELQARGELSDRDVLRVGLALCDALAHAHERGVVHRDVKPQNVIVPDRPRSWRGAAKLTDFGVAMLAGDDALTVTGDVVGTLAYMAPEQAAGARVDERADLYSLALVLFEALAGANPVRGRSPAETARRVGTPLPALARFRRDLPPALCHALDRALHPDPERRGTPADLAGALADAVRDVADAGGTIARHPAERALPVPPRWTARTAAAAAAGALAAGALAALTSVPPVDPAAVGLGAAALVAVLPRAGWLLAAAAVVVALLMGTTADGRSTAVPGSAALLLLAVLPIPLLLSRAPLAWSAPALAPALGVLGLAGAFPALAVVARRSAVRAAIGACGAWWLLLAEPLIGRTLLAGPAAGVPGRAGFESGAWLSAEVVAGTVSSGLPLLVALWAGAALVLPWLVRGRSLARDAVAAIAWSAGLAAATEALSRWVGEASAAAEPRGLVAGAIAAGALALTGARMGERRYLDA